MKLTWIWFFITIKKTFFSFSSKEYYVNMINSKEMFVRREIKEFICKNVQMIEKYSLDLIFVSFRVWRKFFRIKETKSASYITANWFNVFILIFHKINAPSNAGKWFFEQKQKFNSQTNNRFTLPVWRKNRNISRYIWRRNEKTKLETECNRISTLFF